MLYEVITDSILAHLTALREINLQVEMERYIKPGPIRYGHFTCELEAAAPPDVLGAATVNWVTQTAFAPPLVAVGVKADSGAYAALKATCVAPLPPATS